MPSTPGHREKIQIQLQDSLNLCFMAKKINGNITVKIWQGHPIFILTF